MNDPNAEDLMEQAAALIELRRASEALPLLQAAARIQPENADILCRFSQVYASLGEWKQALEYANNAASAAPDSEWAHRLRSFVHRHLGNVTESIQAAHQALRISSESKYCLRELADSQLEGKYYDLAEATAWRIVEKDPEYTHSYVLLANSNNAQERWARAEWCARKALEIDPQSTDALHSLAAAITKGKRSDGAGLPYYVQILQMDPDDDDAQKRILSLVGGFPLWIVPTLVVVNWIVLLHHGVHGVRAFIFSVLGAFILTPILYKFFPQVLLYPQPACWRLPAPYRRFVVRTWQKNWFSHSTNVLFFTCFLIVIAAVLLLVAAARFI